MPDFSQLQHQLSIPYLVETVAFLITVITIAVPMKKRGLSPILGYLAVGTIIGPHALGIVSNIEKVQHFAELGVIFLLFTIGLELSVQRLKAFSRYIFGLGSSHLLLSASAIGGLAYLWGNDAPSAIIIGLCLGLSSTAMVIQILTDKNEISSDHGQVSFAVLLFQDLAVVPILILVTIFGGQSEASIWQGIGVAFVKAVVAILFILFLGRYVLRYLFRHAVHTRSIDVFTAVTLLGILFASAITGLAGLSMALGAFLAGLMLAETEFKHQIESEIEPFKGLLLGLFFMAIGMNLDLGAAFERGVWVILAVIGLILIKTLIGFVLSLAFKLDKLNALQVGLLLAEGGEFAFVVIGQATVQYQLIETNVAQFMVVVASISMALTPLLAFLASRASRYFSQTKAGGDTTPHTHLEGHTVIAGYGRIGKSVATVLASNKLPFVAIDPSPSLEDLEHGTVITGDATRAELLRRTNIEHASVLLVTMDDKKALEATLSIAKSNWPNLKIIVRAKDRSQNIALLQAGADIVVPELMEASLQITSHVLRGMGLEEVDAEAAVDIVRQHSYSELSTQ